MKNVAKAWKAARRVLDEHEVAAAPVPVDKIARKYARIVRRPLDDEVSGMLVPLGPGSWAIVVNDNHSEKRQRFTIAHELGHLLLHGYTTPHADGRFKVRFRDGESGTGMSVEEVEANQFAAELLMPRELLTERLREVGLRYDTPDEEEDGEQLAGVADDFEVSVQALSIRLSALQLL